MTWHRIFGVFVLVALFGVLLRPGTVVGVAQAFDSQAPVAATPAGVPVVVRSGGASLLDNPNGAAVRQVETGTIVQALSRTPTGDWIFVEVEAGVQGWLASSRLVSVNPGALPVFGRSSAEQSPQTVVATATPAQATSTPTSLPTATPTATAVPPTATPTAVAQPSTNGRTNSPTYTSYFQVSSRDPFLRTVGVVRAGGASLLDGPSGGVVTILPAGEIVTLRQRSPDDSWLEVVRTDGGTGWVARGELLSAGLARVPRIGDVTPAPTADAPVSESATPAAPAQIEVSPVLATVRTDGSRLNVRSGPGADFPIVAKVENGSSYRVLAVDGDAWVQIEIADAPGGTGWVAARFVALDGELGE